MRYVFLLLLSFLFSGVSVADDFYKAEVGAHYFQTDFNSWNDARDFCLIRADWHSIDRNRFDDFCFVSRFQVRDRYNYPRWRYQATFALKLQAFQAYSILDLRNQIWDFKKNQIFRGKPLNFIEFWDAGSNY
jgi:hypothetical protein